MINRTGTVFACVRNLLQKQAGLGCSRVGGKRWGRQVCYLWYYTELEFVTNLTLCKINATQQVVFPISKNNLSNPVKLIFERLPRNNIQDLDRISPPDKPESWHVYNHFRVSQDHDRIQNIKMQKKAEIKVEICQKTRNKSHQSSHPSPLPNYNLLEMYTYRYSNLNF